MLCWEMSQTWPTGRTRTSVCGFCQLPFCGVNFPIMADFSCQDEATEDEVV